MRLIDADKLGVGRCSEDVLPSAYCNGWNGLIQIIENAEVVDAVPVIRCRDCKFWEPYGGKGSRNGEDLLEWEGGCMKWRGRHLESDFCSYGKRKVENNA